MNGTIANPNDPRLSIRHSLIKSSSRSHRIVSKLKPGNNPEVAKGFLDLIDTAFEQHRRWRETQDGGAYPEWAQSFRSEVEAALEQWLPKVEHDAGLLLRSLRDKAASGIF
jgi:transposase